MNAQPHTRAETSPPRRVRRSFTHEERVAAVLMLNDAGASVRGTARRLGIPETTLRRWVTGERAPSARAAAPRHREDLSEMLQDAFWACAGLLHRKIGQASLLQRATAMCLFLDKLVQLGWRPTPAPPAPPVVINAADLTPAQWAELADIFHGSAVLGHPLVSAPQRGNTHTS